MRMCAPSKVRCILPAKDSESVQCFELFSQCEQVYQVVLIFQRFHEMFL